MKIFTNDLLIDPGEMIEKTEQGILIPDMLRSLPRIGKVVSDSSSIANEGDFVIYFIDQMRSIDGFHKKAIEINGRTHLYMNEAMIDGIFSPPKSDDVKQVWIGQRLTVDINYDEREDKKYNVKAVGSKVFLRLIRKDNISESGIWLPDENLAKQAMSAEVLSMGPEAMRYFHNKDEIQVGDIVRLEQMPSGNALAMTGEDEVWKCNADEISMKMNPETKEWVPVGGYIVVKPVLGELKYHKNPLKTPIPGLSGIGEDYYTHPSKPGILIPTTADIAITHSEVMAIGGGASEQHTLYEKQGMVGEPFSVGDRVLHQRLFGLNGAMRSGIIPVKLTENQEVEYYMIRTYLVEGLCDKDESVGIAVVDQGENAVMLGPSDFRNPV